MAVDFPTSPTTGDEYITLNGTIYVWDGISWKIKKGLGAQAFKYRTIYIRGYVSGGYKSGSPWRNSNRTIHATDITTNLGDVFTYAASYKAGGWSDYYHYMYGMTNTHNGSTSYVGSLNMTTEVERSNNTSWHMKVSRTDADAMLNPTLTVSYICCGGSATVDKHNLVTEVMQTTGSVPDCFTAGNTNNGVGIFFGEFKGWASVGSGADFAWSTETWGSNGNLSWGTAGQPKGLSSKHGYGYGATGSYSGSSSFYKFNDVTGGASVATITRPTGTHGEENMQVGQNWGYMLGAYNGAANGQHNISEKTNYLTDTNTALGSDGQPKGHDGMSSGGCGTAGAHLGVI